MSTTSSMAANRMDSQKVTTGTVGKIIHHRKTAIVLFGIYLAALFYLLFFAENMGRTCGTTYRYNYIPFHEIKRFLVHADILGIRAVLINIVGNIVVFMPFGFFVPRIAKSKMGFLYTTILCVEFSAFIELVQLITKTGCCDVDDIILNTLGGMLGYLAYYVMYRLFHHSEK